MPDTTHHTDHDARVLSHNAIRRFIGGIGFALPIGLLLYGRISGAPQPSISHYYYTEAGDFFVGALVGIAIFLVTYQGYHEGDDWPWFLPGDRIMSLMAAAGALGTAVLPTYALEGSSLCRDAADLGMAVKCPINLPMQGLVTGLSGPLAGAHTASAAIFFGALAYFCLVLFPIGPKGMPERRTEFWTYIICGVVILICVAVLIFAPDIRLDPSNRTVFWAETFAIWAFSVSWLINGEVLGLVKGFRKA